VKKLLLILFCCSIGFIALAQNETDTVKPRQDTPVVKPQQDTTAKPDTARRDTTIKRTIIRRDTTRKEVVQPDSIPVPAIIPMSDTMPVELTIKGDLLPGYKRDSLPNISRISLIKAVLRDHPYFNFFGEPVAVLAKEKKVQGREGIFYFLVGLLIYFGFIRLAFGKYIDNLTTLFFRVTMRQQQIRDQLLQSPLPSLLLNLLYFITGGFFFSLVLKHYNLVPISNQWLLFGYCAALLMVIYLGKFITLKLTGWIFNVSSATDTYIFIVFLVNKMIGIFLLPVLAVMAFAGPTLFQVVMTLAFLVLVIFFIYRFIISYRPIRSEIKLNRFHFFIYLCAFEIAPLLLIYKVLLIFVERSY
jgi:hypothetical protein